MNYQWEVESSAGSGVFVAIPGATSETLTVTANLQKRAIRVVSHYKTGVFIIIPGWPGR